VTGSGAPRRIAFAWGSCFGAVAGFTVAASGLASGAARADTVQPHAVMERAVVRFYSPETGGAAHPRFVDQRVLAFEARLESMAERPEGIGDGYQERHVRAALEHHVGEEMLASLANKLIGGSPPNRRPSEGDLARIGSDLRAALDDRLGGKAQVEAAAAAEQLDEGELEAITRREALAAWYLDRAVSPLLQPTDEQLREVFRTSAHPFRGRPFDEVRAALAGWFVVERVRVAETAFYQGARTRVTVVITR
jgi:hypothetical protein